MPDRIAYLSGEYIPEREARISIFDSALMYGDMAFEMTRTFNRRPYELRGHLNRLYASLKLLEIDCGLSIDEMERITLETFERNLATEDPDVDWQIMHDVSRGPLDLYRSVFPGGGRPAVPRAHRTQGSARARSADLRVHERALEGAACALGGGAPAAREP